MNLISKGATLILQILFVVVLVLLFAWFDPFDILSPTNVTLKDTPVQVESMREIGQLITAEYYGEVISSLREVVNKKDYEKIQRFNTIANDLHEDFTEAIMDFSKMELSGNKPKLYYNAFVKDNPEIVKDSLFDVYLYYIREKIKNKDYKRAEAEKVLSPKRRNRLFKWLHNNRNHWRDKFLNIQTDEFKKVSKEAIRSMSDRSFRHSRLAIVGRGWVKAGFDFRGFTNRNFRYDKTYHRIHFIGLEPEILSATINPWFIPEEGVEGFEFLIAERGARMKPEYTKIVKQRCLDKLRQQALDKQILTRSKENAEQHLKLFFSLLLNDDLKGVCFHTNYLTYTLSVLLQDSIITNEEFSTIDSSLVYYYNNYDDENKLENIEAFINSLKKHDAFIYGNKIHLSNYSSLLFSVMKDRVIDSTDEVHIKNANLLSLSDSLWYSQSDNTYLVMDGKKVLPALQYQSDSVFKEALQINRFNFCSDWKSLVKVFEMEPDTVLPTFCTDSLLNNIIY